MDNNIVIFIIIVCVIFYLLDVLYNKLNKKKTRLFKLKQSIKYELDIQAIDYVNLSEKEIKGMFFDGKITQSELDDILETKNKIQLYKNIKL